jgi:hypothetical protein
MAGQHQVRQALSRTRTWDLARPTAHRTPSAEAVRADMPALILHTRLACRRFPRPSFLELTHIVSYWLLAKRVTFSEKSLSRVSEF